jgi:hypothetical protein
VHAGPQRGPGASAVSRAKGPALWAEAQTAVKRRHKAAAICSQHLQQQRGVARVAPEISIWLAKCMCSCAIQACALRTGQMLPQACCGSELLEGPCMACRQPKVCADAASMAVQHVAQRIGGRAVHAVPDDVLHMLSCKSSLKLCSSDKMLLYCMLRSMYTWHPQKQQQGAAR